MNSNDIKRAMRAQGVLHVFRNLWDNNEFPPLKPNVEHRWEDLGVI